MKRKLTLTQKVLIAAVFAMVSMLLLAVAVWAYDTAQKDQIAPGVTVGGVDIGGRSVNDAREIIQREVVEPLTKPVVVTFQGKRYKLTPKQLNTEADVDGMLDEAVEETRDGGLAARVRRYLTGSEMNRNLEPRVGYSQQAVDKFVARVVGDINREPENASIIPSGDKLRPTPGRKGLTVREEEMRKLIISEVEEPGAGDPVPAPVVGKKPDITKDELAEAYPRFITIDRANFKLRLFRNLKLKKTYTIAVGAIGYDTPAGLYTIQTKEVNPTWHVPYSDWTGDLAGQSIPPGPGNPLKARWMGIYDGAGIHGTDDTGSLGTAASHGCIRMSIPEVVELFDKVEVGDPVYVQ